jgi:hypothetical protein
MKLDQRRILGATCIAALLVSAASATVGCKSNHVDRDGFSERSFDYQNGETDKSGAGTATGTTTITGAEVGALSSDVAVQRIVSARCAREAACNNVGTDKRFTDSDACARNLRSSLSDDLKPSACPRGIDASAVEKCMEAIRSESCNNPVDTISRLAACRTSDMCIKADTGSKR